MTDEELIPAKATTPGEQSDSIVVSFGSEWHELLLAKKFSVVIRKRVPKSPSFRWLYFHINSPVSAICGRAKIERIFMASSKEVLAMASRIHLKPEDIKAYVGGDPSIGCYQLSDTQFPSSPVTSEALSTRIAYHPPQSFFIVSKQAKTIIDEMTGFAKVRPAKKQKK